MLKRQSFSKLHVNATNVAHQFFVVVVFELKGKPRVVQVNNSGCGLFSSFDS